MTMALTNALKHTCAFLLAGNLVLVSLSTRGIAQENSGAAKASTQQAAGPRDGQHDFDFEVGRHKIHLKRLLHPLTGSTDWVEFDGTSVTRKVWDGRAQIEEFETDSPVAGHIEGLTLRLYNPQSHQWSLYWANSKTGILADPPQIGEFKNGRGEFLSQDAFNGRAILVRYVWSDITPDSGHFEQSFSDDGGRTWEVNWITDQTLVKDDSEKIQSVSAEAPAAIRARTAEPEGQHDFDSLLGGWRYHLKRRVNPLTGSDKWIDFKGNGVCLKVWDGRAELDQIDVDGPTGHIEGLTLRLFNPVTRQWGLYWANSKDGKVVPPQIGEFKNGRGEFYAQDILNGKSIFIRFAWTNMTTSKPHFEQSFSNDGGKTWEVNWITDQTRMKE